MCERCEKCCKKSYIIVTLLPFYIVAMIFNFLSILRAPNYKKEYDDLKASWEKPPITSISFDQNYFNNLKGKINKDNVKDLHKALIVKRLDKKYNYKYLLREDGNEPGFHPCGKDNSRNYLFLPNNIECPINELRISNSSDPNSVKTEDENNYYNYKTTKFCDGIYLHYSNENILSNILTDIDFKIVELANHHYENYNQINFTSNRIIEENYTLYLILKDYIECSACSNYENKLSLNIASLIFLFLSLVTLFIDNIKEGDPIIFHVLTTISLYVQIVFQIIIYKNYEGTIGLSFIMEKYYDINELESGDLKYNTLVLTFVIVIAGLYFFLTNHRENDKNCYFSVVYCFYFIISSSDKCCYCCKERFEKNKEKNNKIILDLDNDIYELDNKISEHKREEKELIDKNENIIFEIEDKSKILNRMKDEEKSFWKMNEEEKIKFEKKIKELKNDNELDNRKFENLKNQIKRIEKEINYYKMIEFKQELNNK